MKKTPLIIMILTMLFSCGQLDLNPTIKIGEQGNLTTLYPWINDLKADDIDYVMSYSDLGTINPSIDNTYNIYRINNGKEEINQIIDKLSNIKVTHLERKDWYGGASNTLTLYLKDGKNYILTSDNNSFILDSNYYEYINSSIPSCSKLYGYRFVISTHFSTSLYYNDTLLDSSKQTSYLDIFKNMIFYPSDNLNYVVDEKYEGYSYKLGSNSSQEAKIISEKQFVIIVNNTVKSVNTIVNDYSFSNILIS